MKYEREKKTKKNQQRHCLEWMVIAKAKNSFFKLILLFYSKKHRLLAQFKLHRNIDCLFVFTFETSSRLLRPQNQLWILSILRALYSHLSSIFFVAIHAYFCVLSFRGYIPITSWNYRKILRSKFYGRFVLFFIHKKISKNFCV